MADFPQEMAILDEMLLAQELHISIKELRETPYLHVQLYKLYRGG